MPLVDLVPPDPGQMPRIEHVLADREFVLVERDHPAHDRASARKHEHRGLVLIGDDAARLDDRLEQGSGIVPTGHCGQLRPNGSSLAAETVAVEAGSRAEHAATVFEVAAGQAGSNLREQVVHGPCPHEWP